MSGSEAPRLSSVALCPQNAWGEEPHRPGLWGEAVGLGAEVVGGTLSEGWDWSMTGLFSKPQSYHRVGKPGLLSGGSGLGADLGSRKPRMWPSMPLPGGSLSVCEAGVGWRETQAPTLKR